LIYGIALYYEDQTIWAKNRGTRIPICRLLPFAIRPNPFAPDEIMLYYFHPLYRRVHLIWLSDEDAGCYAEHRYPLNPRNIWNTFLTRLIIQGWTIVHPESLM